MHRNEKLSEMTIAELERRLRDVGSELETLVEALDSGEPLGDAGEAKVSPLTRTRLATELRRVESALLRLAKGRFGTCGRCGGPIELDRLRADPAASRATTTRGKR